MKFIQLTSSLFQEWDNIAHDSADAWLFHLYDWLEVEERVWGWQRLSFLVEHEGRFIGIVPLQMNQTNRVLKSDIMGVSGPALVNDLDPVFRDKVFKSIYQHIEEIANQNQSPRVDIFLSPLSESCLKDRWQVNPLIEFYYTDTSVHTLLVDLSSTEDVILSNLSKDARFQLRKAQEAGYKIQPAADIHQFYEIHSQNYQRTGVSPHPKAYFSNIYDQVCKKGHAAIWEAIDPQGQPVAYEIIAFFKQKAFYWSGCSKTEHLNSGVNYLLQFNSMLWAKNQGALWFETGEAYPNAREGKEKGLTVFKEKFGGELHRLWQGRLELKKSSIQTNAVMNLIRAIKCQLLKK